MTGVPALAGRPAACLRHAALGAALGVSGCAVGPNFHRPAPPAQTSYRPDPLKLRDNAQAFVGGLDIPGQWWTLFKSPALDAIIKHALATNPSLDAAQAALRQARENVYAEKGNFFPSLSASFEPSRTKTATP